MKEEQKRIACGECEDISWLSAMTGGFVYGCCSLWEKGARKNGLSDLSVDFDKRFNKRLLI